MGRWRCSVAVFVAVLVCLACVSSPAEAQFRAGPNTVVTLTPGADHALIASYDVGYFAVGAAGPIQVASLPKAQWTPAGVEVAAPFPRLLFGAFEVRARGCAPAHGGGMACSEWVLATPDGATTDKRVTVDPFPLVAAAVR